MANDPYPPEILRREGACAKLSKEKIKIFFPEDGENYREAISVCNKCPVRRTCAEWAIERNEFGCWGGLTDQNRKTIKINRKRPLPWPPGLEHGDGRKAFKAHLFRGEIPCDKCYKGKPNNGSTLNRKNKGFGSKVDEDGEC